VWIIVAYVILGAAVGGLVGLSVGAALPTSGGEPGLSQAAHAMAGGGLGLLVGAALGGPLGWMAKTRRDRRRSDETEGAARSPKPK
jgi:hypothetical protein